MRHTEMGSWWGAPRLGVRRERGPGGAVGLREQWGADSSQNFIMELASITLILPESIMDSCGVGDATHPCPLVEFFLLYFSHS